MWHSPRQRLAVVKEGREEEPPLTLESVDRLLPQRLELDSTELQVGRAHRHDHGRNVGLKHLHRDYAPEVSKRQREHVGAKAVRKERISNPGCKDEVLVRFEGMVLHDSTSDAQTLGDLIGA